LIVDTATGARYLLGWSMPYGSTSEAAATELSRQALLALSRSVAVATPLQRDAGIPIAINVAALPAGSQAGRRPHRITIGAAGADRLELWVDRYKLSGPATVGDGRFELEHDFSAGGARLLVVRAFADGELVGYRAATVSITIP
jgi:hypothetical protein